MSYICFGCVCVTKRGGKEHDCRSWFSLPLGPGDQTWVFRLSGKPLSPLSHLFSWGFSASYSFLLSLPSGILSLLIFREDCWEPLKFLFPGNMLNLLSFLFFFLLSVVPPLPISF